MDNIKELVGENIRRLRKARSPRWTQTDLALEAGVALRTIQDIETGKHMPQPRNLAAIAQALGVPPQDLVSTQKSGVKEGSISGNVGSMTKGELREEMKAILLEHQSPQIDSKIKKIEELIILLRGLDDHTLESVHTFIRGRRVDAINKRKNSRGRRR